jgi:hypothetical protein
MGSLWKFENGKWYVLLGGKGYDVFTSISSREYLKLKSKADEKSTPNKSKGEAPNPKAQPERNPQGRLKRP